MNHSESLDLDTFYETDRVSITNRNGIASVRVDQSLQMGTLNDSRLLRDYLIELDSAPDVSSVVIELSQGVILTGAGLGVLAGARRRALASNKPLVVDCTKNYQAQKLLAVTGLAAYLHTVGARQSKCIVGRRPRRKLS